MPVAAEGTGSAGADLDAVGGAAEPPSPGGGGVAVLEREVRELVRRRGVDPVAEASRFGDLVSEAASDYEDRAARGVVAPLPDITAAVREVRDAVGGLGPLQRYLDDPEIEEIWINEPCEAASLLLEPSA